MGISDRVRALGRLAFFSGRNGITMLGAALTTAAGLAMLMTWILELTSQHPVGAYSGILLFVILPAFFFLGLGLIPIGILLERRRQRKSGTLPEEFPKVDLGATEIRKGIAFVLVATLVNLAFFAIALYKGVEFSDSNSFCGQVCHTVMEPEYAAFKDSAHSRVGCAQCHIGQGAGWFVKSKLSGTRQLFAVIFKTYSRPIPSPVEALRPARETCEQCHWPQRFVNDRLVIRTRYAEDEASTPSTTVLLMKIGGQTWKGAQGIHGRHLDQGERIRYVAADRGRQSIHRVLYKNDQGQSEEYLGGEGTGAGSQESRAMDCVDCHNRPTHAFDLPADAVDRAVTEKRISRDLPYAKKIAVDLLKAEYPDRATAVLRIPAALEEFYRKSYPEVLVDKREAVVQAGEALKAIYLRNIFPAMKMTWGTHPNNLGHTASPGCFRCHDGAHTTREGKTISAECDACHTILAQEESNPQALKALGLGL